MDYRILSILRGHEKPTTSLAYYESNDGKPYLISGDQDGTVILWNLKILRLTSKLTHIVKSQINTIKVIKLSSDTLVIQSRNDGIYLFDLGNQPIDNSIKNLSRVAHFRAQDLLFSRADAISIEGCRAILAYPSEIANHLITVRIIDPDARTVLSGSAKRYSEKDSTTSSVFDTSLLFTGNGKYHLCVGYEDGYILIFEFDEVTTITEPSLNVQGLKINLIKQCNLGVSDFVSSLSAYRNDTGSISLACGSPKDELILFGYQVHGQCELDILPDKQIRLTRSGVSAIAFGLNGRILAVATWGKNVELFQEDESNFVRVATLKHHSKQVQSLLFIQAPAALQEGHFLEKSKYLLCCASAEGTISILNI